jgi:hypothetical protein
MYFWCDTICLVGSAVPEIESQFHVCSPYLLEEQEEEGAWEEERDVIY